MIKTKIKKLSILLAFLLGLGTIPYVFADYLPVQAYATDTVAGYPSSLRTSLIDPNRDVRFVVEKPDGAVIQIPAQADLEGIAKTDLYGHQTKIAGKYKVAVVYPGSSTSSPQTQFTVYPDQVSITQSTLHATLQMAEAGKDATFLVVTLYDQYRNPITDHLVKLVSSRADDQIDVLSGGVTDNNGRANFKVQSQYPGISVFSAMDVTMNQVLQGREEVVFFAPSAPVQNPMADLFAADMGGPGDVLPGPVDHFDISGLASSVKVGDELSFTVTAKDKDNNVAKNYTGTILISVPDDENATLPNSGEYTFKAADLGTFTFNLSLQFSKLGNQALQVFDKNNFKIAGEFKLEVVSKDAAVAAPTSSDLAIKSPMDGAELGTNLVIISGQGIGNANLKVFDNDIKIGDTSTDADGFFSFEAKNLDSGSHTFYIMSDDGKVSKSVTVKIDTIPPVINSFSVDAQGAVVPGTQITATVQSEPALESAKIRVQGVEVPMSESVSAPGTYTATFAAPVLSGTFPIDVVLVDSLSNKAEFNGKGSITVASPEPVNPPKVEGLEATPGDTIIDLKWVAAVSTDKPIQKYRIYYGTQMDKLDQKIDTKDSAPSWQLRGLIDGTQYFVAVTAVDSQNLESKDQSVKIAATPVAPDLCANVDCGSNGTCGAGVCKCNDGWTGVTCNVQATNTVSQITATPYDSAVTLSWPVFQGIQASYYKIFIGSASGQYSDYVVTKDNLATTTVTDLINNAPYYFAVAALDATGRQISPLSQEIQATPVNSGFRPAAPDSGTIFAPSTPAPVQDNTQNIYKNQLANVPETNKTGPESLWVILLSVVFAYFLYSHKRRVIKHLTK
jgi:hypothetical protein